MFRSLLCHSCHRWPMGASAAGQGSRPTGLHFAIVKYGMPDRLSIHAPVLVNTIGHCAGAVIFGILLHLFLLDWRRATGERSLLPSIAAGLGLLWNLGSLIGMGTAPAGDAVADL